MIAPFDRTRMNGCAALTHAPWKPILALVKPRTSLVLLCACIIGLTGCGGSHDAGSAMSPAAPAGICTFALDVSTTTFNAAGGPGAAAVTTGPGCRWTIDAGATWIRPQSPAAFVGSATLALSIDPNPSFSGRSGTLVVRAEDHAVADRPLVQRGAGCLYSVDPPALAFDAMGTYYPGEPPVAVPIHVHAEPADCRWTATPMVPWLQMSSFRPTSGTGDGTIDVLVAPNTAASTRIGAVVVAGLSGVNPDARMAVTQTGR
jgi:hypothetical protein